MKNYITNTIDNIAYWTKHIENLEAQIKDAKENLKRNQNYIHDYARNFSEEDWREVAEAVKKAGVLV